MKRCPIPGCTARVNPEKLMCREHWFMVPKPLRSAVLVTYRIEPAKGDHLRCCADAIRAVIQQLPARPAGTPYDPDAGYPYGYPTQG